MLIYNTLTKKKEEFVPINPPNVTLYVCGPTVYDFFHVGNARSFLMADVIRRYLLYKGYNVKFAMNLTDIDDKIIKKSNEEKIPASDVAARYSQAFFEDIEKLKFKKADIYPRATENIKEIIDLVKTLVDKGYAYNVDGNVFYDVSKFKEYGKLSGKKIDELESGARVEINESKKSPLDFALWKKAKEGEPYWESPWGKGRPGWHIECSAMSQKHLGETIDIHAGGSDLIFPHHENEIAQSEAAHGKQFVKYWMHFGFLNIQSASGEDEKMSKSLGNFFTARDVLKKYSAETIRMFFNQTHYSAPLSFSDENLAAADKGLEKIRNLAQLIEEKLKEENKSGVMPPLDFEKFKSSFTAAMDDDFNAPQAIAVIFDFVREANREIAGNENIDTLFFQKAKAALQETAQQVLGIIHFDDLSGGNGNSLEKELIELLIDLRIKAKLEKNYALSDNIRDGLKKLGIVLQDGKDKTTFKKVKL
jgi:cysteinyl-tRNA synthetase